MRRRLFTFASAVSLVLCAATAALWVRGYWAWDEVAVRGSGGDLYSASASEGRVLLMVVKNFASLHGTPARMSHRSMPPMSSWHNGPGVQIAGFGVFRHTHSEIRSGRSIGITFEAVMIPCYALVIATAATPLHWLRHRRVRKGHYCIECGYDLRATPDRCPECGTPPNPLAANTSQ